MDNELTSNPVKEKLDETTVMGRTVYVSTSEEKAYVPFEDELVSMTNLRAWNHLLEQGKMDVIDGYERERSLEEKEIADRTNNAASRVENAADDLYRIATNLSEIGETNE